MVHRFTELRGMPVRVRDHEVGEVADLILDPAGETVLGFEIRSNSGKSYFLPLALTMIPNGSIAVASPLHLIEDVGYYRRRGMAVSWPQATPLSMELAGGRVVADTE
jgi:PRC-barrel domain